MKKLVSTLVIAASFALPLAASAESIRATEGTMLMSAEGSRLGAVYRVAGDGSAQLIINGKMATVPASTLSVVDGKLKTSLSKRDVTKL